MSFVLCVRYNKKIFQIFVYTQAEHTHAKWSRKSPVLHTSTESSTSEGKSQIYLLQLISVVKNIFAPPGFLAPEGQKPKEAP